jgi:hypothetical protein
VRYLQLNQAEKQESRPKQTEQKCPQLGKRKTNKAKRNKKQIPSFRYIFARIGFPPTPVDYENVTPHLHQSGANLLRRPASDGFRRIRTERAFQDSNFHHFLFLQLLLHFSKHSGF